MKTRAARIAVGILIAAISMYFIGIWLYEDICLDMGGTIIDGICHDENYHQVQLVVESVIPLTGIALFYTLVVVLVVNFVLARIFGNARN